MFFTGAKIASTSASNSRSMGCSSHSAHLRMFAGLAEPATVVARPGCSQENWSASWAMSTPRSAQSFAAARAAALTSSGSLSHAGQRRVGEKPRGERAGVHRADVFRGEARQQVVDEGGVLQGVAVVGKHAVDLVLHMVEHGVEGLERVAGKPDGADFSLLLELEDGGQGFLPDLRQRHELDVVQQDDVEVVGAEALERDMHGFLDAPGGEIEVDVRVAAELGA